MPSEWENNSTSSSAKVSSSSGSSLSASSSTATSPEPNSNGNNNNNDSAKNGHAKDCALKASTMSHDPTPYVARARVTRPTPPKPSCNPMQFVQIKPCNLYQSAQQQLKKVEEIKKVKEVLKEEPEDWQNNLDNWKSSRRKRVEHIIERVVEVKKLELEEHDRTRRKSKTFSEMMEERGERGRTRPKLQSLASYNEDEANDLSDLGIGTSSASGKSSISEDCEVHSIVSEPPEVEHLSSFDIETNNSCQPCQDNHDRISSLGGYETSSTAPITSPDPYEYTYEGAIEDYKSRVSKASAASSYKKPEFDRKSINLIDQNNDTESSAVTVKKEDLPKIDISKKRELFENQEAAKATSTIQNHEQMEKKRLPSEFTNVRSIKDRLCSLEKKPSESNAEESTVTTEILPGEVYSIKERLQCLKQHNSVSPKPNINKVVAEVVDVPPLKDRLSSLQNAVTKEEVIKKPVVLVDEYQLEMLKNEDMARRQLETSKDDNSIIVEKAPSDDSGINTTDEKIDQEPATTEDEDDEDDITVAPIPSKYMEKVPSSATSNNEFQGEFDSSVSSLQLKNLNTPTVVSLVDKPVVIIDDHNHDDDVVGGGSGVGKTLLNSSKEVVNSKTDDSSDKVCEVNHAQNLLKMFKLAFNDEDDVIKESVKSDQVEVELETSGSSLTSKQSSFKVAENSEKSIEKTPQDHPKSKETNISSTPKSIQSHNSSKVVDSIKPKDQNVSNKIPVNRFDPSAAPESNLNVVLNIDNSQSKSTSDISSRDDNNQNPSKFKNIVSNKVQQLNKISSDSQKVSPLPDKSQKHDNQTPSILKSITKHQPSSPIPLIIETHSEDDSESPPKFVSVSSKVQQLNSLSEANQQSPKSCENSRKIKNPVLISSNSKSQQQQFKPSSPISNRASSPYADNSHKQPIYENINISDQNANGGLKKVSNSENNGRIEIFNSKSMPEKPKSPEVLPRLTENRPSKVQSKDFQQSALNDFIKDLETNYEPIIVSRKADSEQTAPEKEIENIVDHSEKLKTDKMVGKPNESQKPLETKPIPLPRNLEKNTSKPMSPLPLDTCVDILQSFLAAERSEISPANELKLLKSPNAVNSYPSDGFIRQESIVEVPCSKLDVKDLPDPNFIRTPCITVDCEEKLRQESIKPSQALVRDSISSAGDSSPSSDVTVIFKGAPESPTPNKSSLMEIANRMGSPVAARRDPLARKQPVGEKPCLKIDVKDLPDPNFIRTECIDVDKSVCCSTATPLTPSTPGLALQKTNADILKKTCEDISTSPPLSPVLGARNAEKPNFMIARVEVVETKIKVTTTNDADVPPAVPTTAPPPLPSVSPKTKTKSAPSSKPKNIFEFLKKNFQSKPEAVAQADEFEPISVDNSMFYVPSDVISTDSPSPNKDTQAPSPITSNNNGVNIEITKKITSDAIVEQTDSDLNLTEEINDILDEEISKLVVEDAKL